MIDESDRLVLAPGVVYEDGRLTDAVRGEGWPLNESGTLVLERIARPVGEIARETARVFSLPAETARGDVLQFAWSLNALALVNVEKNATVARRVIDWIMLAIRLAPAGALPGAVARRRAIDTRSHGSAFVSTLAASLPRIVVLAAVATAAAAQLVVIAGGSEVLGVLALGLGTGAGIGLHEAGHAAALRGIPTALVMRGCRTHVMHASVGARRRAVVALAGPLAVTLFGVMLVLAGAIASVPAVAFGGCPLAGHAVGLTVASRDGRAACGL